MSNVKDLQFNYKKLVNNLSNQGNFNQTQHGLHKMKHKGNLNSFQNFYVQHADMQICLANEFLDTYLIDLDYYINWLGNNGIRD